MTQTRTRIIEFILWSSARARRPERHDNAHENDPQSEDEGRSWSNERTHDDGAESRDQVRTDGSSDAHEQVLNLVHISDDGLDDVGTACAQSRGNQRF
jgi:hypothetical protein